MRRISPGAWLAVAVGMMVTASCLVAFVRLWSLPPAAKMLDRPPGERLLTVETENDLIVLERDAAFRLDKQLRVTPIRNYPTHHLQAIQSATWHEGKLRLVADGFLLTIDGDEAELIPWSDAFAVHGDRSFGHTSLPPNVPREAVRGMVWSNGEPLFVVSERGAEWLVDGGGHVRKMPEGALTVWSATFLRPPLASPNRVPYFDEDGSTFAILPRNAPTFVVALGRLAPVVEPLEVVRTHRRLYLRGDDGWSEIAASLEPAGYDAFGHILLSSTGREAWAAPPPAGCFYARSWPPPAIAALTGAPPSVWMAAMAALVFSAIGLIVAAARARRRLREAPEQLLVGTLQVPPGAILQTNRRGKVTLVGDVTLRTARGSYVLDAEPRRDDADGAPLVDGDAVYMVGSVEEVRDGGPWRSSGRAQVVDDDGQLLLGRGDTADYAARLTVRESTRILAFALAHLLLALQLFGLIGLRPYL